MKHKICIVVAYTHLTRAIGKNGDLPWKDDKKILNEDLKYFKKLTTETGKSDGTNAVIMGRKTWNSIPEKNRPLSGRLNIVVSRSQKDIHPHVITVSDLIEEIKNFEDAEIQNIFIIGGAEIYNTIMSTKLVDEIYVTEIQTEYTDCDTHFPNISENEYVMTDLRIVDDLKFIKYVKKHKQPIHEEYQYLNLIKEIMDNGVTKNDRTGVGTRSLFGRTMRFSLRDNTIPLLTTKKTFWKGVAVELLWFISGDTSVKTLQDQGVNIWNANSKRNYLDSIGLVDREEGDLGPIYGFQWRHFGAKYGTMHDDYSGKGKDQLLELVNMIKHNPDSRRMIISAWNPNDLSEMSLPPCHISSQFYVSNGELSCQMYQRSADMGLGVPFNIASYSLLTHLLAKCCGLKPGEFIHVIGDCHIYLNHEEALKEQLSRIPRPFPKLLINTDNQDIEKFKLSDFELLDYNPHKAIKMDMAV